MMRRPAVILCVLAGMGASLADGALSIERGDEITKRAGRAAKAPDTSDQLIAVLRDALVGPSSRDRAELMKGLAALRDPALRPLFVQLVQASWPEVRMQAVLATAQIDPTRGIDLLAVQRIESKSEQAELIAAALDRDLLAAGQLEDLARWQTLDDRLTVSIAGLLTTSGTAPAPQRVRAILDDPKSGPELRLHAALVLMQQGHNTVEPQSRAMLDEIMALPSGATDAALTGIMARIKRQRLDAAFPILEQIRTRSADHPLRRYEALATMLAVAPDHPGVLAAAAQDLDYKGKDAADRLGRRLRIALAMLEPAATTPKRIPPELCALLDGDKEPLIADICGVLKAISANPSDESTKVGEAVAKLVKLRHAPATAWALKFAKQRPWQEAQTIRLAVVMQASGAQNTKTLESCTAAAADVCDGDPAALKPVLDGALAAGDFELVWVVLAGSLRSVNPATTKLMEGVPADVRWPERRCGSLRELVLARHAPAGTLSAERCARIEKIALGEGELPMLYRLQAAWIALKARDLDRAALARLLSDASTPVPPPITTIPGTP